jgi:hypothetical protein
MPLIASNIVFAPPPAQPEVKQQIVISGSDWKTQLSIQLEQIVNDVKPDQVALPTPQVKQQIIVKGGDWRNQIFNQLEEVHPEIVSVEIVEPPAPKPKKTKKKSEKLIEYKQSSFMADMLSDHKE